MIPRKKTGQVLAGQSFFAAGRSSASEFSKHIPHLPEDPTPRSDRAGAVVHISADHPLRGNSQKLSNGCSTSQLGTNRITFLSMGNPFSTIVSHLRLPEAARRERRLDSGGLPDRDPGIENTIVECTEWLCRAQDFSTSLDGGIARHYSLIDGWGASYPETTGYIIPTLIESGKWLHNQSLRARAKRALDWLVSIQFPDGAFQGGEIGLRPVVPVAFNTGQILLGLASGVSEFGEEYLEPMRRAARWLVQAQDPDGCWRKYPSPFASPGEKTYDTHASWGLLAAARVDPDQHYVDAALANVRWALTHQMENGWFRHCCLNHGGSTSLTHTVGYALRGIIEAYRYSGDPLFLQGALRTANGLISAIRADGFLPGQLNGEWRGTTTWACLTGTVQTAHCWLLLYRLTGDAHYRNLAFTANRYVRRTLRTNGAPETRGGVKGSFPIHGSYCTYQYCSWGNKFLIDSSLLELELKRQACSSGLE